MLYSLGFVAETGRFVGDGDALSTIFLLAFVPCFLLFVFRFSFLFFVFLHPGMFIFSVPLRLCSSHLLLSASTVFYCKCSFCLCHLYPTPSRNSFVFFIRLFFFFFFRSSYFSGGVFFLLCSRTRYATTWFAYLDSSAFGFSVLLSDHRILGRTLGVLLMLGRKNGLMWYAVTSGVLCEASFGSSRYSPPLRSQNGRLAAVFTVDQREA